MSADDHEPSVKPAAGAPLGAAPGELTLLDYALIVWKRRKLVGAVTLAAALAGAVAHLALPRQYEAAALILPPQEDGNEGMAAKLAGLSGDLPLGMLGIKAPAERYVDILKSQKVADAIIERFGLMARYGAKSRVNARQKLADRSGFRVTKGSLISISAIDKEPETAAQMANAYAEVLGQIDQEINVGKAGRERRFLDERLVQVEKDLRTAQEAWKAFQEKHRIVRVDEGLQASATVMAELEARRIAKEIEAQVLETVYSKTSPQVTILREEVKRLDEKLKDISRQGVRPGGDEGTTSQWLFPAVEKVPALALEQMDLERRLRLHTEVCKLLVTQRELARINEAKERSTLQMVAPATAPDRPVGMGLLRRVVLFAAAGLAAGSFGAYLMFLVAARRER